VSAVPEVRASSSTDEQTSSSCTEFDEYMQCAKHEQAPLLPHAPSNPPAAISFHQLQQPEAELHDADDDLTMDESLRSLLLASRTAGTSDNGPSLNPDAVVTVHVDGGQHVDDDDDDDDEDEAVEDDDEQENDEADTDVYQSAVEVASNVADYMLARALDNVSPADSSAEHYSLATVSEPAAPDSASTSGDNYCQAQAASPDVVASALRSSGGTAAQNGSGNSDEALEPTDDDCQTPESESNYCAVQFSAHPSRFISTE